MVKSRKHLFAEAIDLVLGGKSYSQAAKELGLKSASVRSAYKKLGYPYSPNDRALLNQKIERAVEMVINGATYHRASKKTGIKWTTIQNAFLQTGLKYSPHPSLRKNWAPLIERIGHGESFRQVSRDTGCSFKQLAKRCKEVGVHSNVGPGNTIGKEKRKAVVSLVKSGLSYDRVARDTGYCFTSIRKWCLDEGVVSIHSQRRKKVESKPEAIRKPIIGIGREALKHLAKRQAEQTSAFFSR